MGSWTLPLLLLLFFWPEGATKTPPADIRVHIGYIGVSDNLVDTGLPDNHQYTVGAPYTFEVYLENSYANDYMIDSCAMNGIQFIGPFGCVECGVNGIQQSIETEHYTQVGAIKRTLVHFRAPATNIQFNCQINNYQCCGCAERSCERRPILAAFPCIKTPVQCGYGMSAVIPPPMIGAYSVAHQYPVAAVGVAGRNWYAGWPWWLWLLLALLLLLLLLCCLACLLWAFSRRRRTEKKVVTTRIATLEENKSIGIGTEQALSMEKGVGTNGSLYKEAISTGRTERIIPAVITDDGYNTHREEYLDTGYTRVGGRRDRDNRRDYRGYDTYSRDRNGGAYSVREGKVINEKFTRTTYQNEQPSPPDRSSYRNYAYERDMGRVAPMSGFDEVETLERKHYLSDDDSEIIEKDIKRTHTTRFVQETRTVPDESDSSSEKYREEGEQHVVYAPNLRV